MPMLDKDLGKLKKSRKILKNHFYFKKNLKCREKNFKKPKKILDYFIFLDGFFHDMEFLLLDLYYIWNYNCICGKPVKN